MTDERDRFPPDDIPYDHDDQPMIEAALDEARTNLAMTYAAMETHNSGSDEDRAVIDMWVNITYDTLRATLPRQQLLRAIVILLNKDAHFQAQRIIAQADAEMADTVAQTWGTETEQ